MLSRFLRTKSWQRICVLAALACLPTVFLRGGAAVSLTPSISVISSPPARPAFGLSIVGDVGSDANGNTATDYVGYFTVGVAGYSSFTYSIWNYLYSDSWADPRGNLGQGIYTYLVNVDGYHMEPYNNGWIDGHDEDEHDNPDDPDEVTGSHWVDGRYDAGFNWQWQTLGSASLTFTLNSGVAQSITFANPGARVFGDTFSLGASASSGLPVNYTIVSGPASTAGGTVTITGVGSVVIQANQGGGLNSSNSTTYAPATSVQQTFTTGKIDQTITFPAQAPRGVGVHPLSSLGIAMSANALAAMVSVTSGPATISGGDITITSATGTVTLTATQPGDANHFAATPVSQSFSLLKGTQLITAPATPGRLVSDAPFSAAATVNSGLPIIYTLVSGPAAVNASSGLVTLSGTPGTVTIRASQDLGDGNWNAATAITYSYIVTAPVNWVTISLPTLAQVNFSTTSSAFSTVAFTTNRLPIGSLTARLQTPAGVVISGPVAVVAQAPTSTVTIQGSASTGNGLTGAYFNDTGLSSVGFTTTDWLIDNYWGGDGPGVGSWSGEDGHWEDEHDNPDDPDSVTGSHWVDGSSNWDQFSIRWTGYVQAPTSENYTFFTTTDDGVRLWINGNLVVNDWSDQGMTDRSSGPITLVAGQSYAITMEYYENWGDAGAQLSWSSPSRGREIVPHQYLFTSQPISSMTSSYNWTISGLTVPAGQAVADGYRLNVIYTPADGQTVASNATGLFNIANLALPTISFPHLNKTLGDPAFALSSTSSGLGTPAYSIVSQNPASVATLSGGIVTVMGGGVATLRVTYPQTATSASASAEAILTVAAPPIIVAQPQALSVIAGQSATFLVDTISTIAATFQWRKNGVDIPGANAPSYVIADVVVANTGNYSVSVTNARGTVVSSAASLVVTTLGQPVTVLSSSLDTAVVGQPVILSSLTTDPDGALASHVVDCLEPGSSTWIAGSVAAGTRWTGLPAPNNLLVKSFMLSKLGTWQFRSTGTDNQGASSVPQTKLVVVSADTVAPAAPSNLQVSNLGALTFVLSWSAPSDNVGVVGYRVLRSGAVVGNPTLSYLNVSVPSPSTLYQMSVQACDAAGNWSASTNLAVTTTGLQPPLASFSVTPNGGIAPATLGFDASATSDPNGTIVSYAWDFDSNGTADASGETLTRSFNSPGNYIVKLTVNSSSGLSSTTNKTVTIGIPPVSLLNTSGDIYDEGSEEGATVAGFTFVVGQPGTLGINLSTWTNRDSIVAEIYNPMGTQIAPGTSVQPGTYSITVRGSDNGVYGNYSLEVSLYPGPRGPSASFSATPSTGMAPLTVAFNAAASSDPDAGIVLYQWDIDSNNTIDKTGVTATHVYSTRGVYTARLTVTDSFGLSSTTTRQIDVQGADPVFTLLPQNQTVTAGTSVSLAAAASGSPAPTFQWVKNGSPLASATNAVLALASPTVGDSGTYAAVATNTAGVTTSSLAVLSVNPFVATAPAFATQPRNQEVIAGGAVTFYASATGAPAPTYQWFRNGAAIGGAGPTLTISLATQDVAGSYSVEATNSVGVASSNAATLTVRGYRITVNGGGTGTPTGGVPGTSVSINPPSPFTGMALWGWELAPGTPGMIDDSGAFVTTVTTGARDGSVYPYSWPASMGAYPPRTTIQVPSTSVAANTDFTVTASTIIWNGGSLGNVSYQQIETSEDFGLTWVSRSVSTATSSSPSYLNATLRFLNPGTVLIRAWGADFPTNLWSVYRYKKLTVVISPPVINSHPVSKTVLAGESVTFEVGAQGSGPLTYQWKKEGQSLAGATNPSLVLESVNYSHAGTYTVVVTNTVNTAVSNPATLTINAPPIIVTPPVTTQATAGGSAAFSVVASSATTMTYQWRKNENVIAGATGSSLNLVNIQAGDVGNYDVVVTNAVGQTTSPIASLTLVANPFAVTITNQPTGLARTTGPAETATFYVAATGTGSFTYQWTKAGVNLTDGVGVSGATSPNLTLTGLTSASAGSYRVIVTNVVGPVTSDPAVLTITILDLDGTTGPAALAVIETDGTTTSPTPTGWPNQTRGGVPETVAYSALNFSVNAQGEATAGIPIAVTPGVAGLEPKISLGYNHNAGNGYLGVGWSVQGLSMITRRPGSRASDSTEYSVNIRPVNLDANDYFALDGQRLIRTRAAGVSPAEYRTEIDSFSRILAYPPASGTDFGPIRFEVYTKSGLKMDFGLTSGTTAGETASRIMARAPAPAGAVLSWAIDTITDRSGNTCKFYYTQNSTTGEYMIDSIRYGPSAKARVDFKYEQNLRPDVISGYQSGAPWSRTKRLEKIESMYDGVLMRRYVMGYEVSQNTNRSRLSQVQEFDSGSLPIPAMVFKYRESSSGWLRDDRFKPKHPLSRVMSGGWMTGQTGAGFVDLDGDGFPDFLHRHAEYAATTAGFVAKGSSAGWVEPSPFATQFVPKRMLGFDDSRADLGVRFVDVNSDGYPDIISSRDYDASGEPKRATYLNTATGWSGASSTAWELPVHTIMQIGGRVTDMDRGVRFVDLDGDGRVDVIWSRYDSSAGIVSGALRNTTSGWAPFPGDVYKPPVLPAPIYFSSSVGASSSYVLDSGTRLIDINGDGLVDILCHWPRVASAAAYLNTGNGWAYSASYAPQYPIAEWDAKWTGSEFIDVNGDGLPDQVVSLATGTNTTSVSTWLNTGRGWTPAPSKYNLPKPLAREHLRFGTSFVEVNGDGLVDMISSTSATDSANAWRYPLVNGAWVYINTPTGWSESGIFFPKFLTQISADQQAPDRGVQVLDVNGDGMPDIVEHVDWANLVPAFNSQQGWINQASRPDLLETITHSSGLDTKITYATLAQNDGGFYEQGARASDSETRPAGSVPILNIRDARSVVKTVTEADGLGSLYDLAYSYKALRHDPLEGALGFESVTVKDSRVVTEGTSAFSKSTTTAYRQIYPFVGLPRSVVTQRSDGRMIAKSATDWKSQTTVAGNGRIRAPYGKITEQGGYNVDAGATAPFLTKTVSVASAIDAQGQTTGLDQVSEWGDVLKQTTEANDGYVVDETRVIKYVSSAGSFPGQVDEITTTTTASTQSPLAVSAKTRVTRVNFDNLGRISKETREPLLTYEQNGTTPREPTAAELATYLASDPAKAFHLVTDYAYDSYGHVSSISLSSPGLTANRVTSFEYSATWGGRFLTKKTNPEQHYETFEDFDAALGVAKKHTDINRLATTFTFDGLGRVLTQTAPGNVTTTINRNWVAEATGPSLAVYFVETIPDGAAPSLTFYDRLARPLRAVGVTPGLEIVYADTSYDTRGNVVKQSRPYFVSALDKEKIYDVTTYDVVGRVARVDRGVSYPTATTAEIRSGYSTFAYSGFATTETRAAVENPISDGIGHSRSSMIVTTVNSLGAAASVVESGTATTGGVAESLSATLTYSYDGFGSLVKIVDPISAPTIYTVDAYGRRTAAVDPNRGTWTFRYNPLGEVTFLKDAENRETTLMRDRLGRVTSRNVAGIGTSWTFDTAANGKGRLASLASFDGLAESYEYDTMGRMSKSTRNLSGTISGNFVRVYDYDDFHRLKTVAHWPNSIAARFVERRVYNGFGHWVALRNHNTHGRYWVGTAYEADGQVTEITYGNGVVTDRTHQPHDGLLDTVKSGLPSAAEAVQNLQFCYEASRIGSLYKRLDHNSNIGEAFSYDALNRLRTTYLGTIPSGGTILTVGTTYAQTYDLAGNLTSKVGVGSYAYYTPAEVLAGKGAHAIKSIGGGVEFTYDLNGNLKSDGAHTVNWNVFNQPSSINRAGAMAQSSFTYDADFQRLTQVHGAEATIYLGGGHERRITAGVTEDIHYLSGPFGRMGQVTWRNGQHADVRYFHHDHLGSVDAITKLDGTAEVQSYDAWGERRNPATRLQGFVASTERRGYTDHEMLDDVRLIHMNGRIYDPRLGRFLSVDPVFDNLGMTQGVNAYSYVRNNPLSFTDPSGLASAGGDSSASSGGFWSSVWAWLSGGSSSVSATATGSIKNVPAANNSTTNMAFQSIIARNQEISDSGYAGQLNAGLALRDTVVTGAQLAADFNPVLSVGQMIDGKAMMTGKDYGPLDYAAGAIPFVPWGKVAAAGANALRVGRVAEIGIATEYSGAVALGAAAKVSEIAPMLRAEGILPAGFSIRFATRNELQVVNAAGHGPGVTSAAGTLPSIRMKPVGANTARLSIERLKDGTIPIVLDGRLTRDFAQLRAVVRHEVAEGNYLLPHAGRTMTAREATNLSNAAHAAGQAAQATPR